MSIASSSSNSTSSEVNLPAAFRIYRNYNDKDDWDGDVFLDKTTHCEIHDVAPPPYIVLVQGPPNVGKSLLIKSLVKHFTMEHINDIQGPITILTGDKDNRRRIQFVECPDDINTMIDASKYADLVLFLVDASYGFEAETFEFVNLLRAHGFPPVMGVLTHLDEFNDETELEETKERLQDNFRTEIYQGAMISCLSGLDHDLYKMLEVEELARHILMFQLCLSSWRAAHPYVLVDRFEDVTPPEKMDKDANCDRNISLYGYLRGCNIKSGIKVHIAGVGDFRLANVTNSADPFRLSSKMEEENDLIEPTHIENGFRAGNYLRLEVHNVPFGWVQNLDPSHPILVGGISPEEENVGHMQARLKLHNWHMKLLRSAEPVTVSAGWRRYQTNPIYGWEFIDGQRIMLEFNLEHGHCLASFCGPLAPPGTRIVVVQSNKDLFRIVAKAAVVDPKDRRVAKAVVVDPKDQLKLMEESKQIPKRRTALTRFGDKLWLKRIKETKLKEIIRRTLKKTASKRTAPKRTSSKRTAPKRTAPKQTELEILTPIQTQSITCGEVNKVCATYENNILSMLEERRRVEIIDEEPSSYPCSSHFMLLCRQREDRETVVVMSEEKRAELVKKQQIEEFEKAEKEYFSGVRQLVDL